ncbi:hypothetical protein LLG95_09840 [bacterium]|nr:hypothetical protein [bacterium]
MKTLMIISMFVIGSLSHSYVMAAETDYEPLLDYNPLLEDSVSTNTYWLRTLKAFSLASRYPESKRIEITNAFLKIDIDKLPPEGRFGYYQAKLWWLKNKGDWAGMNEIRDKLMLNTNITRRNITDSDLLALIEKYYSSVAFFPPEQEDIDRQDMKAIMDYWSKHYQNYAEAERISQFIIDNYDSKYITVASELNGIAYLKVSAASRERDPALKQRKIIQAYEALKKADMVDTGTLYSIDRIDVNGNNIAAKNHLKVGMDEIRVYKRMLPKNMVDLASQLPSDRVMPELQRLENRFENNTDIKNYIQKRVLDILRLETPDTRQLDPDKGLEIQIRPKK